VSSEDVMNLPEYIVHLPVTTSALPSSFDNVPIVTEESKELTRLTSFEDRMDKELKLDCLSPPSVLPSSFQPGMSLHALQ
jgi:hypothetical protein